MEIRTNQAAEAIQALENGQVVRYMDYSDDAPKFVTLVGFAGMQTASAGTPIEQSHPLFDTADGRQVWFRGNAAFFIETETVSAGGTNKWTDGNQIVTTQECPGEYWYPVVSMRRVRGSSYTPYQKGSEAWVKAANRTLASHAQSNFERR